MGKKKNQHYVFQGYLKPWSEDDKVYCLREGRVFQSNLTGVACENYFYRLRDLTSEERQLIEKSFLEHGNESLQTIQRKFISLYSLAPKLRKHLDGRARPKFTSLLDEMIANGEEDYHQRIEDSLLVFTRDGGLRKRRRCFCQ